MIHYDLMIHATGLYIALHMFSFSFSLYLFFSLGTALGRLVASTAFRVPFGHVCSWRSPGLRETRLDSIL